MRIQVATLPDVPDGEARNEANGASGLLVTVTSIGGGGTHKLQIKNASDPTNVPAITPPGTQTGIVFTFTPVAALGDSWLLELIVDEGLVTQARDERTYAIRTPNRGLRKPVRHEKADPSSSLQAAGDPDLIAASQDNAGANQDGWAPHQNEVIDAVDVGGGAATIVGQVLYSKDGATFEAVTPLTSSGGWLVNDDGLLLIVE